MSDRTGDERGEAAGLWTGIGLLLVVVLVGVGVTIESLRGLNSFFAPPVPTAISEYAGGALVDPVGYRASWYVGPAHIPVGESLSDSASASAAAAVIRPIWRSGSRK